MSTEDMQGIPSFPEPQEELHFPEHFEFVGNDVSPDGNRPAQTKHQLLESWPHPTIIRGIAKFIGFAQFYSIYIHHVELHIAPLRNITIKLEYTDPVGLL